MVQMRCPERFVPINRSIQLVAAEDDHGAKNGSLLDERERLPPFFWRLYRSEDGAGTSGCKWPLRCRFQKAGPGSSLSE